MKRTPEWIAAKKVSMIEYWKQNKASVNVIENAKKIGALNKGRKHSEEQKKKHSEIMKGWNWSEEVIKKRAESNTGLLRESAGQARGPDHIRSIQGSLRSPMGVTYKFKNVIHFVEENPNLFEPKDLIKFKPKVTGGYSRNCNAAKRICALFRGQYLSWKGWTVITQAKGSSVCNAINGMKTSDTQTT